jgi:hypothetical protein
MAERGTADAAGWELRCEVKSCQADSCASQQPHTQHTHPASGAPAWLVVTSAHLARARHRMGVGYVAVESREVACVLTALLHLPQLLFVLAAVLRKELTLACSAWADDQPADCYTKTAISSWAGNQPETHVHARCHRMGGGCEAVDSRPCVSVRTAASCSGEAPSSPASCTHTSAKRSEAATCKQTNKQAP